MTVPAETIGIWTRATITTVYISERREWMLTCEMQLFWFYDLNLGTSRTIRPVIGNVRSKIEHLFLRDG